MKCPACSEQLVEHKQSDLTVDVCDKGCGGIWFDNFELSKVDEAHEGAGEVLLDIGPHKAAPVDHATKRNCPRCNNMMMIRNFFSVKREIEIDSCPNCAGVWLDAHELATVRSQFKNEAEREKAFKELFTEDFKPQMDRIASKSEADLKKKRQLASAFRFICPSNYLPGHQKWGAF